MYKKVYFPTIPPAWKFKLKIFSIFNVIEVVISVIGTKINLSQKNVIFLCINNLRPQTKLIKKIRTEDAPNSLINKSEVYAPYFPRILLIVLSERYVKEESLISKVIIDAAIAELIIKRIKPIVSRSFLLKKGIFCKLAELLNFKTIKKVLMLYYPNTYRFI